MGPNGMNPYASSGASSMSAGTPAVGVQSPISNPMSWSQFGSALGMAGVTSVLDTGLGMFSSWFNRKQSEKLMEKQQEYYLQNYNMQREDALEDYARQREDYLTDLADERQYNSAAAVKDRLLEAGINPNSISGQFGTASSGAVNTAQTRSSDGYAPNASAAAIHSGGLVNAIAPLMTASLTQLKARQMETDMDNVAADTLKILEDTKGIGLKNVAQKIANDYLADEKAAAIAQMTAASNMYVAQTAESWFRSNNLGPAQIASIRASIDKAYADIDYMSQMLYYYRKLGVKVDVEKSLLEFQRDVLNPLQEKIMKTQAGVTIAQTVIDGVKTTTEAVFQAYSFKNGKGGKVIYPSPGTGSTTVPPGTGGGYTPQYYEPDFENMILN